MSSKSIYFLTSAESRVRAYCDICKKSVDGVACIIIPESKMTCILLKCHGKTFGTRITDELVTNMQVSGFLLQQDEKIRPVERTSKMENRITVHFLRLEDAIRQAKEKIYKKLYSSGQWVEPAQFGIVKSNLVNLGLDDKEEDVTEIEIVGKGRRIIMED